MPVFPIASCFSLCKAIALAEAALCIAHSLLAASPRARPLRLQKLLFALRFCTNPHHCQFDGFWPEPSIPREEQVAAPIQMHAGPFASWMIRLRRRGVQFRCGTNILAAYFQVFCVGDACD